ncbi:RelA/SpoT family protein [Myxococcota bacterium]|nr:RelA/SpoT family protein [Myxococcota bacterium]MBU1409995.1 RelA/SpoT family protein [Myxococcota bacterium]MBU1511124.1 RelA/SpoT family protein [Myxococcota bacterium]
MKAEFERIRETYLKHFPGTDTSFLDRVAPIAEEIYASLNRVSGDPYLMHALAVSRTVAEMGLDRDALIAALLHDAAGDPRVKTRLGDLWTPTVQMLVENLERLRRIRPATPTEEEYEGYRRMMLAVGGDLRAVLIRISDRLDNMRTLRHLPREEQVRVATEVRHIAVPLANRLGLQAIKSELENLAFLYLEPEAFLQLDQGVKEFERARASYVDEVVRIISARMTAMELEAVVYGRPKHLYSIHLKMLEGGRQLEDIHDIIGFRILVDSSAQCYAALGLIHSLFKPVEGRFKDYIAVPKPNGYQSLHTTVLGPRSRRIEIQIRTRQMHEIAEKGVAAHWFYKERSQKARFTDGEGLSQVDLHAGDAKFWSLAQYQTEIFVFTPRGQLVVLPVGSCPVDFAFMVHSLVGVHCTGARVNGLMVPLKTPLKTMDVVEILTSQNQWPKSDWLKFVVTGKARNKIRYYLNQVEREQLRQRGRELLERDFKRRKISLSRFLREDLVDEHLLELKCQNLDDLLLALGDNRLTVDKILAIIHPVAEKPEEPEPPREKPKNRKSRMVSGPPIAIEGMRHVLVKLAQCCRPVPGEDIVGFVTRAQGVSVHRQDCPRVVGLPPQRLTQATWILDTALGEPIRLRVVTDDRPGLLAQLSEVFAKLGINIRKVQTEPLRNNRSAVLFHFTSPRTGLEMLIRNLKKIKGVHSASKS